MPQCARLRRGGRGWSYMFENTTSSGTIESSRCYTPKLNEANNVYFAVNRKSLTAFVCLRMRTKEATDIILGWKRSRKNMYTIRWTKNWVNYCANVVLCSLKCIIQDVLHSVLCRYATVNKFFLVNIFEVWFLKYHDLIYEDKNLLRCNILSLPFINRKKSSYIASLHTDFKS